MKRRTRRIKGGVVANHWVVCCDYPKRLVVGRPLGAANLPVNIYVPVRYVFMVGPLCGTAQSETCFTTKLDSGMSNDCTGFHLWFHTMNSLLWRGIQYMPPKRKNNKRAPKRAKNTTNTSSRELAEVTRLLKNLNTPKSQVTDLGRMLLTGGNAVSSMFGFPKIFGSGSYAMQNSCWNAQQQVPIMHSSSESINFKHREYIGDITMNGASFNTVVFNINPGLATTFPFLASVASNFQEYRFKGLVFEYKTTSATAITSGTNTALGSVMLAVQYRSDATPFVNKTQLLNEMWSVDAVPSSNAILPVECSPQETVLSHQYVRSGGIGTGDIKMFDLGLLTVATYGGQSGQNNVVGELWASYDVDLLKPQIGDLANDSEQPFFAGDSTTSANATPFLGVVPYATNTLTSVSVTSGNGITFTNLTSPGIYSIFMSWASDSSTTITQPTFTFIGGVRAANYPGNYNSVLGAPTNGAATYSLFMQMYVYVSSAGGGIVSSTAVLPITGASPNFIIFINPVGPGSPWS